MNEKISFIPSRVKNCAEGGHVAGARDIIDDDLSKDQQTINAEVNAAIDDAVFIDDSESSSAVVPEFDPESQTVHVTAQTLSEQQKAQVRTNIGLGDVDAEINEAVATEATRARNVESALDGRVDTLETAVGTGGSVDSRIAAAVNALDSTKSQSAGADGLALSVTEVDGKITSISGSIAANTYDAAGAASTEATRAQQAESALDGRVTTLETAVGSGGSVDSRIAAAKDEIKGNATSACDTLGEAEALISAETSARQSAISNVIGDAASDYNTLGKLEDKIQAEATRAEAAEQSINSNVTSRLNAQDDKLELLNGSEVEVVADHTAVSSPDTQKIYREYGTNSYTDYMYQNSAWQAIATYDYPGVDDEPTAGSDNLVKSGGVAEKINQEIAIVEQESLILPKITLENTSDTTSFVIKRFAIIKGNKYTFTNYMSSSLTVIGMKEYNAQGAGGVTVTTVSPNTKSVITVAPDDYTYIGASLVSGGSFEASITNIPDAEPKFAKCAETVYLKEVYAEGLDPDTNYIFRGLNGLNGISIAIGTPNGAIGSVAIDPVTHYGCLENGNLKFHIITKETSNISYSIFGGKTDYATYGFDKTYIENPIFSPEIQGIISKAKITELQETTEHLADTHYTEVEYASLTNRALRGGTQDPVVSPGNTSSQRTFFYNVNPGERYRIRTAQKTVAANDPVLGWAVFDNVQDFSLQHCIARSQDIITTFRIDCDYDITIPVGGVMLVVGCRSEYTSDVLVERAYEIYGVEDELKVVEPIKVVPNGQDYAGNPSLDHNSWCHNMVLHNSSDNIITMFYTSAKGHGSENYGIFQVKQRNANGVWSAPSLVGDAFDVNFLWYSSAAAYDNGNYIILAKNKPSNDQPLYKLTSNDLVTWSKTNMVDGNGNNICGDGPCCLKKLSSGRWIFFNLYGSYAPYVYYSDNDMVSWVKVTLPVSYAYPCEGDFYECNDGTLLLLVREGNSETKKHPLLYSSADGGETWTFKKELLGIDCDSNPIYILKCADRSKVVLFYCSRFRINEVMRVHYLITSENNLKEGILTGEKTIAYHKQDTDIGYCSAVSDNNGLIHLFWYAGSLNKSHILTTVLKWNDGLCADL